MNEFIAHRTNCLKIVAAFFLASQLIACGSSPTGIPADGKRWYFMHNCFACHGKNAKDGKAPQIAGLNMHYSHFLRRLRYAESAIMPEYSPDKISDQDAADILAWLKTIK